MSANGAVFLIGSNLNGYQPLNIPAEYCGYPSADQLQGTPMEMLAEIAGRTCYDSFGRGRSSQDFHNHVLAVEHLSVYEHCVVTLETLRYPKYDYEWFYLVNMPNVFITHGSGNGACPLRVTVNLRHILDWSSGHTWWRGLQTIGQVFAPHIISVTPKLDFVAVPPQFDEELWISLLIVGSRGFSHEQVRHGDWTAISQRSTRYCDESISPYIQHPLIQDYRRHYGYHAHQHDIDEQPSVNADREAYRYWVDELTQYLKEKGVSSDVARKQARGAARGYLGNALETRMVFSASLSQWKHMIKLRCSAAADAEIRVLYAKVHETLALTLAGTNFKLGTKLVPSPDGIGEVAVSEDDNEA